VFLIYSFVFPSLVMVDVLKPLVDTPAMQKARAGRQRAHYSNSHQPLAHF